MSISGSRLLRQLEEGVLLIGHLFPQVIQLAKTGQYTLEENIPRLNYIWRQTTVAQCREGSNFDKLFKGITSTGPSGSGIDSTSPL